MNTGDQSANLTPEGHPIHTLLEEHRIVLEFAEKLVKSAQSLREYNNLEEASETISQIKGIVDHIKASQKHYLREENVLFPYLEKHGITSPPAQMWVEHDQIRAAERNLFDSMQNWHEMDYTLFVSQLEQNAISLSQLLAAHYHKENTILFPMAIKVFAMHEWQEVLNQFSEIGYCCFTPEISQAAAEQRSEKTSIEFETHLVDTGSGRLSRDELVAMLNTLPVEITFVDKNNVFRYFNKVKDPIFVRTVASTGTKVQNCHPRKSVHMVNKIIEDFRSGDKDSVSFWIHLKDKYVYIRYFAVRNNEGEYLGCMEVTQDIKDIQEISGENRLMD